MRPISLLEIVEAYIKEKDLPFYFEENKISPGLVGIRRLPKGLSNSIGFVSARRGQVCIYEYNGRPTMTKPFAKEWINPFDSDFFEHLDARLRLHI